MRHAERGDKRRIFELAERNARLALDQDRLRSERRRSRRIEALDGLQRALGMDVLPMRIECFDISNLGETHTVASMVVFEGGAPKKSDYRRFGIREAAQDDFAAMAEVLSRRMAQYVQQRERSPHDRAHDASFAAVPALIVIDGGRGQLSSGLKELGPFRDLGTTVVSLAKRIEEVFVPGRRTPLVLPHDTPELQLLQRVRDEAHRFAIEFHRGRRDKAMTRSVLDDLPGVGPARKRAAADPLRLAGALPRGQPRGARGRAGAAGKGRPRDLRLRPQDLMSPVLIKACLNGARGRADHPGIPVTPAELADEARAAVAAGAGALHFHPRGADGAETLDPAEIAAAVAAVRSACPGIPVGVTTGLWIVGGDADLRLELIEGWAAAGARPDFASVNLSEEGNEELADCLRAAGIGVEAGVWSVANVEALAGSGFADDLVRVLIEPVEADPEAAVGLAGAMEAALDAAGIYAPRLHHGVGAATWAVLRNAISLGRDIRVGLEDTLELPDGTRAEGNGALVAAAAEMAQASG